MANVKRIQVGADGPGVVQIEAEEAGEGGPGIRPFVLVHGFTGSRDDFADVLPRLAERRRTVILDQRGHGGSTNTGRADGYDFETMAGDLRAALDGLGIERCDLLGHSMGGMVSMRFALAHPERVASLVLMDTAPGPIAMMPVAMLEAGAKLGREQGMRALADIMRQGAAADPNRAPASRAVEERWGADVYFARIRAKLEQMDPEAMETLGRALGDHDPCLPTLAALPHRTLVMVGEQDRPFLEPSRAMADTIPNAALVTIPDAAHSPQFENEAAWLEAIEAFLG